MLRSGCALSMGGGGLGRLGGRGKQSQMQGVWCGGGGGSQNTQIWPHVLFKVPKCCAVQESQED